MASFAIPSSLLVGVPSPTTAKAAAEIPANFASPAGVDAGQAISESAVFGALLAELTNAAEGELSGDAVSREAANPEEVSDGVAALFAVDVPNSMPQPWGPLPEPSGNHGFELAAFASATAWPGSEVAVVEVEAAPSAAGPETALRARAPRAYAMPAGVPDSPEPALTALGGTTSSTPIEALPPRLTAGLDASTEVVGGAQAEAAPAVDLEFRTADGIATGMALDGEPAPIRTELPVSEPGGFRLEAGDEPPAESEPRPAAVALPWQDARDAGASPLPVDADAVPAEPPDGAAKVESSPVREPTPPSNPPTVRTQEERSGDDVAIVAVPAAPPAIAIAPQPLESAVRPIVWKMARTEDRESRRSAVRASNPGAEALPERSAVRLVAAGVREKGELAFTARMAPAIVESPTRPTPRTAEPFAVAGGSALPETIASNPAPPRDDTPEPPEAPSPARQGARAGAAHEPEQPASARPDRQTGIGVPLRSPVPVAEASLVVPRRAEAAEPPQAAASAALDTEPAPTKPSSPAREIRLELATGEERVEVKLSEKAGELKVAVRTVDSNLAERLRGDLPALASRLDQRGLRTETWQPSQAGTGDWRRPDETAATNSGGTQEDASRQQGREQQHEGEPRHPHVLKEEDEQLKDKRKDFEWFLSATQ